MVSNKPTDSVVKYCPLARPEPTTSLTGPASSSVPQSWVEDDTQKKDSQSLEDQDLTTTFPTLRVFSNYAEIQKERQNPFSPKPKGILKIVCDTAADNRRVVSKVGKINTHRKQRRSISVIVKDLFIAAIHLSWSWTFFYFFGTYFLSWFLFSLVWYCIGWSHGDFTGEPGNVVCVENMVDFTSAFLFSIETQHTIGYGVRATTTECPIGIIVMSIQSIVGVFLTACVTGIVFAKFTCLLLSLAQTWMVLRTSSSCSGQ